jgi:spore photoproduct lyase
MIPSLKEYRRRRPSCGIPAYNRRRETVIITRESFDFYKPCPCTPGAVSCGYHILNLAFGCLYECVYCYLQLYSNSPGLIFPANLDDYFDRFRSYRDSPAARAWRKGPYLRIGTGEFSDSLMLDEITAYSPPLVEFFREWPGTLFEFKTKSDNIGNLLRIDPRGRIVVGWTLNPPKIIAGNEFYTASLSRRLRAARRCGDAGYRLAFHFDPIIYYPGWERDYAAVLEELFSAVRPEEIAWISLGTLRFRKELKGIMENRFPENTLLDRELIPGFDGKLRYPRPLRFRIYRTMIDLFRKHHPRLPLYLCMEEKGIREELKLPDEAFTRSLLEKPYSRRAGAKEQ